MGGQSLKRRQPRTDTATSPMLIATQSLEPEERSNEYLAWVSINAQDFPKHPETRPTQDATVAVLRRALASDYEAELFPDSWPEGLTDITERDLAPRITPIPLLKRVSEALADQDQRIKKISDVICAAAGLFARSYPVDLLHERLGRSSDSFSSHRMVAWINRYPYCDGVGVWFLAPAIRRMIFSVVGPGWYFHQMDHIRRSKSSRPWLIPRGYVKAHQLQAPLHYGWEALEAWLLRLYLMGGDELCDNSRLETLVKYAADRMRGLSKDARRAGTRACDFEALCQPLRRSLFWYASQPLGSEKRRKQARNFLTQLQNALIPRLPPREPQILDDDALHGYKILHGQVKRIWKEAGSRYSPHLRKKMLENQIAFLQDPSTVLSFHGDRADDSALLKAVERRREQFWKACGDLLRIRPDAVARLLLKYVLDLDLEPQAIKEELARAAKFSRLPPYQTQHLYLPRRSWTEAILAP